MMIVLLWWLSRIVLTLDRGIEVKCHIIRGVTDETNEIIPTKVYTQSGTSASLSIQETLGIKTHTPHNHVTISDAR